MYYVEVQRSDNDDHYRRIRYNASLITSKYTPKSVDFRDVKDIYVIYITEFDLTGIKSSVVHIDSAIRESGDMIDDGLYRMIVNAKVQDGTKVSRLMSHFLEKDFVDDEFPESSKMIHGFKHTKEGRNKVCQIVEEYAAQVAEIRELKMLIKNIDSLSVDRDKEEACRMLGFTLDDYENAIKTVRDYENDNEEDYDE